jgi:hypothetical protein
MDNGFLKYEWALSTPLRFAPPPNQRQSTLILEGRPKLLPAKKILDNKSRHSIRRRSRQRTEEMLRSRFQFVIAHHPPPDDPERHNGVKHNLPDPLFSQCDPPARTLLSEMKMTRPVFIRLEKEKLLQVRKRADGFVPPEDRPDVVNRSRREEFLQKMRADCQSGRREIRRSKPEEQPFPLVKQRYAKV